MGQAKQMPVDLNRKAIQTLRLNTTTSKITIGGTTARVALPTGVTAGDIVRVASNTDCYINFGTSAVDAAATNVLFTQGVEMFAVPPDATHLAAIQVSTAGVLTITEVY